MPWQPISTAPRDGTRCLFFARGGGKRAGNQNAEHDHMRVDAFSDRWPRGLHQLPEAPYVAWTQLPDPPVDIP